VAVLKPFGSLLKFPETFILTTIPQFLDFNSVKRSSVIDNGLADIFAIQSLNSFVTKWRRHYAVISEFGSLT